MAASTTVRQVAERYVTEINAAVWAAAAELPNDAEFATVDDAQAALDVLVQKHIAKTHAGLLIVQVGKRSRHSDNTPEKRPKVMRKWCPKRPTLCLEVAQLLEDGIGLVEAPPEKQATCELPYKIFSKQLVAKVGSSSVATGFSASSIQYAVGEVIAATFAEAEQMRTMQDSDGILELHCSTDAAWKGTSARGTGIAFNQAGRHLITSAASVVAEKMKQLANQPGIFKMSAA